ncbi:MAG: class II aldolase/adducin family protein [Syntrophomonadaceae bacterium]|jgi:L-ribulose-5-phosphate 4-epimerase|nr:class II aldolase/adducin family protein [Syntrophomonadaceae bacterium]
MRFLEERRQVLAAAREISQSGMVMGTWGNVSMRCPEPELMLITPSGVDYQLMSMEDMVLLDSSYRIREGSYKPSIETPLHMEIYRNREGVKAIVHVHSIYASSFAVARKSIPVILEETAQVVGHEVPVAEYALCGTQALATAVLDSLGEDRRAVLLANHGLLAAGVSMEDALRICYVVEKTAQIALYAQELGGARTLESAEIVQLYQKFKSYGPSKIVKEE